MLPIVPSHDFLLTTNDSVVIDFEEPHSLFLALCNVTATTHQKN